MVVAVVMVALTDTQQQHQPVTMLGGSTHLIPPHPTTQGTDTALRSQFSCQNVCQDVKKYQQEDNATFDKDNSARLKTLKENTVQKSFLPVCRSFSPLIYSGLCEGMKCAFIQPVFPTQNSMMNCHQEMKMKLTSFLLPDRFWTSPLLAKIVSKGSVNPSSTFGMSTSTLAQTIS